MIDRARIYSNSPGSHTGRISSPNGLNPPCSKPAEPPWRQESERRQLSMQRGTRLGCMIEPPPGLSRAPAEDRRYRRDAASESPEAILATLGSIHPSSGGLRPCQSVAD